MSLMGYNKAKIQMKKTIFILSAISLIAFGLVSCGDDSNNSSGTSSNISTLVSPLKQYYGRNVNDVATMLTKQGFFYFDNDDYENCMSYRNSDGIICELEYNGDNDIIVSVDYYTENISINTFKQWANATNTYCVNNGVGFEDANIDLYDNSNHDYSTFQEFINAISGVSLTTFDEAYACYNNNILEIGVYIETHDAIGIGISSIDYKNSNQSR